jgi:hypothetical protein
MNKPTSTVKKINFQPDWSAESIVEWISSNKKMIAGIAISFLTLFLIFYALTSTRSAQTEKDFFISQNTFQSFQQSGANSPLTENASTTLKELRELMIRHPELQAKYEGPVAQTLLISDQVSTLPLFTKSLFERTSWEETEFYQLFAKTSLLIASGKWNEAKQEAVQLQESLDALQNPGHQILSALNFFRLGILNKELGNKEEELRIWNQLDNYWKMVPNLKQMFTMGQSTLEQWVTNRKTILEGEFQQVK